MYVGVWCIYALASGAYIGGAQQPAHTGSSDKVDQLGSCDDPNVYSILSALIAHWSLEEGRCRVHA